MSDDEKDKMTLLTEENEHLRDGITRIEAELLRVQALLRKTEAELAACKAGGGKAAPAPSDHAGMVNLAAPGLDVAAAIGKGVESYTDADGQERVWVTEKMALRLFATAPDKFFLTGPVESLEVTRGVGLYNETFTVDRHVFKDGQWVATTATTVAPETPDAVKETGVKPVWKQEGKTKKK